MWVVGGGVEGDTIRWEEMLTGAHRIGLKRADKGSRNLDSVEHIHNPSLIDHLNPRVVIEYIPTINSTPHAASNYTLSFNLGLHTFVPKFNYSDFNGSLERSV